MRLWAYGDSGIGVLLMETLKETLNVTSCEILRDLVKGDS